MLAHCFFFSRESISSGGFFTRLWLAAVFVFVHLQWWSPSELCAVELIDFNSQIRPILSAKCFACHGPDESERAAGLRLDRIDGATQDLGGYAAIAPGDAASSEMLLRVTSRDEDLLMPPPESGSALTSDQVAILKKWIQQGAKYSEHWSYVPPRKAALPEIKNQQWIRNEIDHFILSRLEDRKLSPATSADRLTLARRLSLDLIGLPPTWEEATRFRDDKSVNAYEAYVDYLLDQPAFGERWARVWLDLARYADSAGYADDPPRTIWAYRDYVIKSLNENKSFDDFTIEQIAGDLLPNPKPEQLIATAFHRNTLTNNEGGTNDEEFRNVAVVDRVNTTMAVWMGTTAACAQCHTHKYDPITQKEYFELFAFFNNSQDADRRDEQPLHQVWSEDQIELKEQLQQQHDQLLTTLKTTTPEILQGQKDWLSRLKKKPEWKVLAPTEVDSETREAAIKPEGWIHLAENDAENDSVMARFPITDGKVSGLQLEVSHEQSRNFVLSGIDVIWEPEASNVVGSQYVRVELPGQKKMIHLAEIQLFVGEENVAVTGKASQSSTDFGGNVAYVNDGNTDGLFNNKSVTHTAISNDPWIEIDLGSERDIDRIVLWNRTDGGEAIQNRLRGYKISLMDADRQTVWSQSPQSVPKPSQEFSVDGMINLAFSSAIANHEQSGFPASSLLDGKTSPNTGWAIAPHVGKSHALTLVLEKPRSFQAGNLVLHVKHESKHLRHLIDHFRVSVTGDEYLQDWADVPGNLHAAILAKTNQIDVATEKEISEHYLEITPLLQKEREKAEALQKQLSEMKPLTTVPIMRERESNQRRKTYVQIRGNYLSKAEEVTQGTPKVFHPISHADDPNRLDLAKWLVDTRNPLTARVIANRHWEQIFGSGIVATSEEFGSQGDLPTHPELLDWLAVELMESGWDLKHLIKTLVMSATYRQSSVVTEEMQRQDPDNQFYTRGPRFRASAEVVRDQVLSVAGLLSDKMYGPPVKPPQPKLGLTAAFGSGTDWNTSAGDDRYRRGIYTTWRRSSPYPSMAQFDAPNREVCTIRRIRTNTPLQALVTLNDPVYVEAAQAFARKVLLQEGDMRQRITFAFKTALTRVPTEQEYSRIEKLIEKVSMTYSENREEAMQMATEPLGDLPGTIDVIDAATWTVVANVVLNLDEILMKK